MKVKEILRVVAIVLISSMSLGSYAQTVNEAGDAFNKGIEASKAGNFDAAIASHLSCIEICNQIGAEGDELKGKAEKQLPKQYLNAAITSNKAKDTKGAFKKFKQASKYAEKVGDTETKAKADKLLSKFYTSYGLSKIKKKDLPKALEYITTAQKLDPKNTKVYYAYGTYYKAVGDEAKMKENFDKCIAMGGEKDKSAKNSKIVAGKYYVSQGSQKMKAKDYKAAIALFNSSMEYKAASGTTYYYLAIAYNSTSNWDKAIESADKGIAIEKEDKSNLYFEKGKAFEGKGDLASACSTYKMVTTGANVASAKYKIETELKCK
jgi:tetratricopeptide (TPR) repeat protein